MTSIKFNMVNVAISTCTSLLYTITCGCLSGRKVRSIPPREIIRVDYCVLKELFRQATEQAAEPQKNLEDCLRALLEKKFGSPVSGQQVPHHYVVTMASDAVVLELGHLFTDLPAPQYVNGYDSSKKWFERVSRAFEKVSKDLMASEVLSSSTKMDCKA